MKTCNLAIVLLIISMNVLGQNNYYWYKSKKIPLTEISNKRFILLEDENIESVLAKPEVTSWKIDSKGIDNTIATLIPYINIDTYPTYRWEIIEKIEKESSLPPKLQEQEFYSVPYFKTQEGEEVGLSHLFYVKLFKKSDFERLEKMAIDNNVKIIGKNRYMPLWYTLACTKDSKDNALEMANMFFESGEFDAAVPDLMVDDLPQCVDDTYFDDQWHLNNEGQYGGTSGIDINICDAWGITEGCNDIVIAVLDHGIELNHPDLLNMFPNSYDSETNSTPSIIHGPHGTACAGVIGAASGNNDGIAGVAPDCQLMSVSNSLDATPNSRQRRGDAINWAWHNGADVISNSWGSSVQYPIIDNAIDSALTFGRNGLGCVVVFASGNDNSSVNYPANSNPDIITVGAMSPCGERKNPNSCDGENWGSNYGNELDLVAPGVLIATTDRQGNNGYNPNISIHTDIGGNKISSDYSDDDYTVWFNGTSSACPQVAGVAALILSINPELTQDEVRDIIESTCRKVGGYTYTTVSGRDNGSWNNQVGYGCVDAFEALRAVYPITGPSLICSSGASFTINTSSSVDSIIWETGPYLTVDSGQYTNSPVIKATGNGSSWVTARLVTDCGSITLPQQVVWAGAPKVANIDGPTTTPNNQWAYYTAQLESTLSSPTDYNWILNPLNGNSVYDYGQYCDIAFYNSGSYQLVVQAKNTCSDPNYGPYYVTGIYVYDTRSLSISPNPATGETTLTIESGTETEALKSASVSEGSFDDNAEWDVEIYSPMQALKTKKTKLKGNSTTIQTSGWTEGVYTVRVKYKDEILTGKLVVKR